jgi:RNA polymerase sigma-70 factor (ECF subfamily)
VMLVLYLIFNQGNNPRDAAGSPDLAAEAIALTRNLRLLLPATPEIDGLLALMLLHHARRHARLTSAGDLILLDQQDRALWDRAAIDEGLELVESALRNGVPSPYSIQAAIAAVHASAHDTSSTDWPQIVALYDVLLRLDPSPVIALNRAVAVAMSEGPAAGLQLLADPALSTPLATYSLFHSARGDLHRRLSQHTEAAASYRQALEHVTNEADRRFLTTRLAEVESS